MSEAPETYKRFKAGQPAIAAAYEALSALTLEAGPLNGREQRLVKLGVALGAGSPGGVRSAMRKALDAGACDGDLRHAALLALVTIGLPDTLLAMKWADELTASGGPDG